MMWQIVSEELETFIFVGLHRNFYIGPAALGRDTSNHCEVLSFVLLQIVHHRLILELPDLLLLLPQVHGTFILIEDFSLRSNI